MFHLSLVLQLTLSLLVLRVFTDHHHTAVTLDDLALFADLFYGRLNFHSIIPPFFLFAPHSGQNAERAMRDNGCRYQRGFGSGAADRLVCQARPIYRKSNAAGNAKPPASAKEPVSPPSNSLSILAARTSLCRPRTAFRCKTLWKWGVGFVHGAGHTAFTQAAVPRSHAAISLSFSR